MTQLKIERHGLFDYRWRIENVGGFNLTRSGAIRAAQYYLKTCRNYALAKQTAEIIQLDGEQDE